MKNPRYGIPACFRIFPFVEYEEFNNFLRLIAASNLKKTSAGILEQSIGARNRVGIGLSYLPASLNRLAESVPGPSKSLKIPFQFNFLLKSFHISRLLTQYIMYMTSNFTVLFEGGSFTENRKNKLKSCKNHIT
jgi:hypothetical protein